MRPLIETGTVASYPEGGRTDFWRVCSWYLGDKHADRICWAVSLYCRLMGRGTKWAQRRFPR